MLIALPRRRKLARETGISCEEHERNGWTQTQAERGKAKMTSEKSLLNRVLGRIPGRTSAPLPLVTASRILGHIEGTEEAPDSQVAVRSPECRFREPTDGRSGNPFVSQNGGRGALERTCSEGKEGITAKTPCLFAVSYPKPKNSRATESPGEHLAPLFSPHRCTRQIKSYNSNKVLQLK